MATTELPIDIISIILCRLPVKPLLRFKCVSKTWYFLITSPDFSNLDFAHSLNSHQQLPPPRLAVLALRRHIQLQQASLFEHKNRAEDDPLSSSSSSSM